MKYSFAVKFVRRFIFIADSLFFFSLPEKRTDSLSVFVYTMSDYSLILLNVQGLIYIFFISIRMEEEYNRNDLSYHRGGRKKKIIELKENVL